MCVYVFFRVAACVHVCIYLHLHMCTSADGCSQALRDNFGVAGEYYVDIPHTNILQKVFCQWRDGYAYTLIESFVLSFNIPIGFMREHAINADDPSQRNTEYALPLLAIAGLTPYTEFFKATCNEDLSPEGTTMEFYHAVVDLFKDYPGVCAPAKYIHLYGEKCSTCGVPIYHSARTHFHTSQEISCNPGGNPWYQVRFPIATGQLPNPCILIYLLCLIPVHALRLYVLLFLFAMRCFMQYQYDVN